MIITIVRKPFKGSLIDNVKENQCGGISINDTRIASSDNLDGGAYSKGKRKNDLAAAAGMFAPDRPLLTGQYQPPLGRWPANFLLTDTETVIVQFPKNAEGCRPHRVKSNRKNYTGWGNITEKDAIVGFDDGEDRCASRYFFKVIKDA